MSDMNFWQWYFVKDGEKLDGNSSLEFAGIGVGGNKSIQII